MSFWLYVLLLAVCIPLGLVALTHPDGQGAVLALLSSRRALFLLSLLATGLVAGLFAGTQLGQLRVQEGLNAVSSPPSSAASSWRWGGSCRRCSS